MMAQGQIQGINGNMVTVAFEGRISLNEVAYIILGGKEEQRRLKAEVIRVRGALAQLQVFELTKGLGIGARVEFTGELLAVELGPGLLTQIYDGLQNPLPELAQKAGYFLERGVYLDPLPRERQWGFTPTVEPGESVSGGDTLGTVPEGAFQHRIMVPFDLEAEYEVLSIAKPGRYTVEEEIAQIRDTDSGKIHKLSMMFTWPVKRPINKYSERLKPVEPMVTKVRLIDTFFPVALGGTYCIPGPFGAGKTVLQQITSRHAEVDIVIIAACGERAGEVVETLVEFPELTDPKTGRSLMERTIIICNTSSMPVAAREASVYTGVTLAEYFRQMGLNVLLLADSTSRWAQSMREMSGRLEEIPGEEAFPAYLESNIAAFYERAGIVRLKTGEFGSVTIGGSVSPAGGNFEEPVTQATLKVVGAFHGLSRERSDARKFPAIHPIESWSKYDGSVPSPKRDFANRILHRGFEVEAMMKVVGEEGTSMADYLIYEKGELIDSTYIQQNSFHPVDAAVSPKRQNYVFDLLLHCLLTKLDFGDKDEARQYFQKLRMLLLDMNAAPWENDEPAKEFLELETEVRNLVGAKSQGYQAGADEILEAGA